MGFSFNDLLCLEMQILALHKFPLPLKMHLLVLRCLIRECTEEPPLCQMIDRLAVPSKLQAEPIGLFFLPLF